MTISINFAEIARLQVAIAAAQGQAARAFAACAKPQQAPCRASMGGEMVMDVLATPLFSALLGGGMWEAVNMAQVAFGAWSEERAAARPAPPAGTPPAQVFAVVSVGAQLAIARRALGAAAFHKRRLAHLRAAM
jgi:hypothetical protein